MLPEVRDREPLLDMKERGVAYARPRAYQDIEIPKNSPAGVIMGGLAFVLRLRHGVVDLVAGDPVRACHVGHHDLALVG